MQIWQSNKETKYSIKKRGLIPRIPRPGKGHGFPDWCLSRCGSHIPAIRSHDLGLCLCKMVEALHSGSMLRHQQVCRKILNSIVVISGHLIQQPLQDESEARMCWSPSKVSGLLCFDCHRQNQLQRKPELGHYRSLAINTSQYLDPGNPTVESHVWTWSSGVPCSDSCATKLNLVQPFTAFVLDQCRERSWRHSTINSYRYT